MDSLRVVNDVPRNIESIPLRAKPAELPTIDVGYLGNQDATWLQYPSYFAQQFARISDMFDHMEHRHDIE